MMSTNLAENKGPPLYNKKIYFLKGLIKYNLTFISTRLIELKIKLLLISLTSVNFCLEVDVIVLL